MSQFVVVTDPIALIVLSDQSGNKQTYRGCSIAKSEVFDPCAMSDSVTKLTNGKGRVDYCETCEADLCNGASHQSFTQPNILITK